MRAVGKTKGQLASKSIVLSGRNFKLVPDFMHVQIIKSHKNLIKTKRISREGQIWSFRHSRASNSEVNSPIWPEFELIRDFMAVLISCKFEDDLIKSEGATLRTTFSPLEVNGEIFHHQGRVTPK